MPRRLVKVFARLNPRRSPEDSLALRASVLASILTAELTILAMGYYGLITTVAVPLLTAAGFYISWRRRRERNLLIKLILAVMVVAAAVIFLRELAGSLYDTRLPLIRLFLWLQVMHSFDLPARRDLKFSLVSGLILITAGAVLSISMTYIAGLALFSAAAVAALIQFQLSEDSQRVDRVVAADPWRLAAGSFLVWLMLVSVAVPVMLVMPQSTQARLTSLPVSELTKIFSDFPSEVVNPYYREGGDPFDRPPQFSADSYYGFNPYMDLRSRGRLSDDIVLKVRSDRYDFYRGIVFDVYNGKGWEMSDEEGEDIVSSSPPFELPVDTSMPRGGTSIQSFYIQADLPNIIFSGWRPVSLFFPADRIKIDKYGSLRSPYQLTDDTVYSVVTEQPLTAGSYLRRFPRAGDPAAGPEYTALPDAYGADILEIEKLTRGLTGSYDNTYDKVLAVERYLKETYPYDLEIGPQRSERDAVAYFLFEEQAGYCEHFASAMAVMLRSVGIPARVVTGYTGGSLNPFTGLWEVRQSDAHAWVEVYFGSAGWVGFDPTPGFDMPGDASRDRDNFMLSGIIDYLGGIDFGPAGRAVSAAGAWLGRGAAWLTSVPLAQLSAVATGAAALAASAGLALRRLMLRRRQSRLATAGLSRELLRDPSLKGYLRLLKRLAGIGLARRPEETLRRFARRVSLSTGSADFEELNAIIEELRYSGRPRSDGDQRRVAALSLEIDERLREGRAATGRA
ncbi:MAG: DUF4129 domain-containing protein [Gaiellales bacterium]|nr:MAG: DUF4129 domain-containing protein [Gaiellales bacterium]